MAIFSGSISSSGSIGGNGIRPSNIVVVNQESDFPVQDATTITVEADTAYLIGGPITTSKTLVGLGGGYGL